MNETRKPTPSRIQIAWTAMFTLAVWGINPANAAPEDTKAGSAASQWFGSIELYGFGPLRITGDTTVNGFTAETDLTLGEALPALEFGFSLRGALERDRIGVQTDLSYVRTGAEKARTIATLGPIGLSGVGEVSTQLGLYDFAVRYRLGNREAAVGKPGQYSLIPYAGVRLVQASLAVNADLNNGRLVREGRLDRVWVQPLVGSQASIFLSRRLRAFARADIGVFGAGGSQDLSGNAQLGFGYGDFQERCRRWAPIQAACWKGKPSSAVVSSVG